MKNKVLALFLTLTLASATFTGCGEAKTLVAPVPSTQSEAQTNNTEVTEVVNEETDGTEVADEAPVEVNKEYRSIPGGHLVEEATDTSSNYKIHWKYGSSDSKIEFESVYGNIGSFKNEEQPDDDGVVRLCTQTDWVSVVDWGGSDDYTAKAQAKDLKAKDVLKAFDSLKPDYDKAVTDDSNSDELKVYTAFGNADSADGIHGYVVNIRNFKLHKSANVIVEGREGLNYSDEYLKQIVDTMHIGTFDDGEVIESKSDKSSK